MYVVGQGLDWAAITAIFETWLNYLGYLNSIIPLMDMVRGIAVGCGGAIGLWLGSIRYREWLKRFDETQAKVEKIRSAAFYAELDRFYAELLTQAVERPYLRQARRLTSDREIELSDYDPFPELSPGAEKDSILGSYDAYAFMVWNFLETIHDRCDEFPNLHNTWATIVAAENRVHRGWFLQQLRTEAFRSRQPAHEPSDKFCKPFQVFVVDKNFLPDRDPSTGRPILDAKGEFTYSKWSYEGRSEFETSLEFQFPVATQSTVAPRPFGDTPAVPAGT